MVGRGVALCVLLAACSGTDRAVQHPTSAPSLTAPGLRLPDTIAPVAYDLKLDIDPDSEVFKGDVTIRARVLVPTDQVWIHADQLAITTAEWNGTPLVRAEIHGEQMVAFRFGRVVAPGEITLHFAFGGNTDGDQEGLFRQRDDGWFVFSQGEAVFTRRVTPCFDEPRFRTPWKVTLVVPRRHVALSNMPDVATTVLGATKQVVFEETPPMPSYLLAIAVGPFELVDAGTVGANKVPLRVAVTPSKKGRVGVVAARVPAIVAALEKYLGEPLPLKKLDLVVVPRFFGAMENPGLITIDDAIATGDPKRTAFASYFSSIAAHELAHQWFGNIVTSAWWDDLWVSEAFASWLGEKILVEQRIYDDPMMRHALARREALDADREHDKKPLWHHVTTTQEADEGFGASDYSKGQVILETIETFVGVEPFREAVRAYLAAHRGTSITTEQATKSFAVVLGVPVATALKRYLGAADAPVVDLAMHCDGAPVVIAKTAQKPVPLCLEYPTARGQKMRACVMVGESTSIPIGASGGRCPAHVRANPDGAYVHVHWTTDGTRGPAPAYTDLDALGRIVTGDDLASAVDRGELPALGAIGQLDALADLGDIAGQLGAIAIARAIDPLVDDAARPAWTKWLASQFAARIASDRPPRTPGEAELSRVLTSLLPGEAFPATATRRAYAVLDRILPDLSGDMSGALVRLAAVQGGDKLFDRIATRARLLRDDDIRETWLESLGEFGPAQIPRAIALVTSGDVPVLAAWSSVRRYFERPATRSAAWRAMKAALPAILRRMSAAEATHVIDATAFLCDPAARADVEAQFRGPVHTITDGGPHLATALKKIDACIARRHALGDVAAAVAGPP